MKRRKLSLNIIISLVILCIVMCQVNIKSVKAAIYNDLPVSYIDENFPESYMPYINALKTKHPNWVFKAVHTGLDWNTALSHETYEVNDGISLVQDIFGSEWKRDGKDYYKDGAYVTASKQGVAYVMDPRNFINEQGIFQFEVLSYSGSTQTVDAVQGVLAATPMGGEYKSKYKSYGEWKDLGTTYAELIHSISEDVGVNPVHIAARIRQENSGNIINGSLINGDYGLYNFFNIGAYDTANANAITNGLNKAKEKGWTDVPKAIRGGVEYIYNQYVKWGQDTIYFERFDVNNPGTAQWLLGTGYMTNIFGAKTEALMTYNTYDTYGLIDRPFEFHIPVYENMSDTPQSMPLADGVSFKADNTRVYLDDPSDSGVTDEFWIRTGPDTFATVLDVLYETKDGAANRTKFTRIGIGQNTLYDKIRYDDGREGYILKKWIYEYTYNKVSSVSLDTSYTTMSVGDTLKLKATVKPKNAEIKDVTWKTSDKNIATVDTNGNVTAKGDGVVTITVTTKDQNKTAICTINVVSSKVTSITIPKSTYYLRVGETLNITPTITPADASNKEYTVESTDLTVITVNGKELNAVGEGTATVIFTTKDGKHTAKATINVTKTTEENKIIINNLVEKDGYITNIDLNNNTVDKIKDNIDTTYDIVFKNISGTTLKDTDKVGTGTVVSFTENGKVVKEYTIIIYGDVDGSGVINARDLLMLQRYILNKVDLKNIQVKAAIIDKTSQAPRAADLLKIQRHILGKYTIEQ